MYRDCAAYDPALRDAFGERLGRGLRYGGLKLDLWHTVRNVTDKLEPGHASSAQCISELWGILLVPDEGDLALLKSKLPELVEGSEEFKAACTKHVRDRARAPDVLRPAVQQWHERCACACADLSCLVLS